MFNFVGRPSPAPQILPSSPVSSSTTLIATHYIIALLIGLVYATVLVQINWEELRGYKFIDRTNYINYFLYSENVLSYTELEKWYHYMTREVLWHMSIPYLIKDLGLSIHTVLNAISFFSVFTAAFVAARFKAYWAALFLTSPMLITLTFDQLRMAFSFSLLLWGYVLPRKLLPFSLLLCLLAPFFHTSAVLFIALFVGLKLLPSVIQKFSLPHWSMIFVLVFVGASMSFMFGDILQNLLAFLGDRRAEVYAEDASSGIKYTSFWLLLLIAILIQPKVYFDNIIHCFSVIILSFVSFNLIFGGYSLRFLSVSLPFLMIAMLNLKDIHRLVIVCAYVGYNFLQWSYWIR